MQQRRTVDDEMLMDLPNRKLPGQLTCVNLKMEKASVERFAKTPPSIE